MLRPANKRGREGQVLLFASLNTMLLFGVMSLAIDLSWAYFKVQQAQGAADAAAMAGAVYALNNGHTCGNNGVICGSVYQCPNPGVSPPTTDLQAGCLYAAANGFVNAGNQSVQLTANSTTPPGSHGNQVNYWVQATVGQTIPGFFSFAPQQTAGAALLLLALRTSSSSSAVSTAAITITPSASCIFAIGTDKMAGEFSVGGSATVTSSCGIFVNSSDPAAIQVSGSAKVQATQILVHGGYTRGGSSTISPTPVTGATPVADPLAGLTAPSVGNCDHINWSTSSSTTLDQGVYCGGITITGSGTVTFNSGVYIINGGGFNYGGTATLNGSHVMFFITGKNGYTAAPLNANGGGSINFSAPSFGSYEGVLFYQDRTVTYGTANTFIGNTSSNTTGAFYFPTTSLSYSGSSTGRYQALVAKAITMAGNANFMNDPSGTFTGLTSRTASLIQ